MYRTKPLSEEEAGRIEEQLCSMGIGCNARYGRKEAR